MKKTGWIAWMLIAALLVLSVVAYLILRTGGATIRGSEMNADRTVFNVANAVTLTGFQLTTTVNDYKTVAQLTIFILIVCGSLVSILVGGWAIVRAMGMPFDDVSIALGSVLCFVLAVAIGTIANLKYSGLGASIFDAVSAFGNSGLWLGNAPTWEQVRTHTVLLPLAVLGGLGVPVLLSILNTLFRFRKPHPYAVDVLVASALIYMVGTLVIGLIESQSAMNSRQALLIGSTEVLNSRSLGLPLGSFGALSRPSQWICLLLMLIGANPGGTGAGCMTVFVFIFLRGTVQAMRGKPVAPLFGLVGLWIVIYLLAALTATLLLIGALPQVQSDRLLFLAISAIGNVGASHEPLTLTGSSLYILSGAMFFGRLAPLGLLWWAAHSFLPQAAVAPPPVAVQK